MPAKKAGNKKTPKKRAAKKPARLAEAKAKRAKKKGVKKKAGVQKHIEEAAARIPDMIVEEAVQPPPPRPRLQQQYHHHHGKQRRMMWIGVAIIAAVICVMWLLNVRSTIETVYDNSLESDLLKNTQSDFTQLLNQLNPDDQETIQDVLDEEFSDDTDAIKNVISDSLNALIKDNAVTSSSEQAAATSTLERAADDEGVPADDEPKDHTEE